MNMNEVPLEQRIQYLIQYHIDFKDHPDYTSLANDLRREGLADSQVYQYLRKVQDGDY